MHERIAALFSNRYGEPFPADEIQIRQGEGRIHIVVIEAFECPRMRRPLAETLQAIAAITGFPVVDVVNLSEGDQETCYLGSRFGFSFSAHDPL